MRINGLQKTTLLDYPGKVSCIVFVGGCNFRCPFCHNSDLVLRPEKLPIVTEKSFFSFLKSRKGLLEGVVITGGEPTLYPDLPMFIRKVKGLGFSVKLDTNGSNPDMVKNLIQEKLADYVAIDLKGPIEKYDVYIGTGRGKNFGRNAENVVKSMKIVAESGAEFEFRTTVVPTLHSKGDLLEMAKTLSTIGRGKWYLQQFSPKKCLNPTFENIAPYPKRFFDDVLSEIQIYFPAACVRDV